MVLPYQKNTKTRYVKNYITSKKKQINVPSSWVLTVIGQLAGPSPTLVPASTQILYSVHLLSSSRMNVVSLSLITLASLSERPASTTCSLQQTMFPLERSAGGGNHDTRMAVGLTASPVTLVGGAPGTILPVVRGIGYLFFEF